MMILLYVLVAIIVFLIGLAVGAVTADAKYPYPSDYDLLFPLKSFEILRLEQEIQNLKYENMSLKHYKPFPYIPVHYCRDEKGELQTRVSKIEDWITQWETYDSGWLTKKK